MAPVSGSILILVENKKKAYKGEERVVSMVLIYLLLGLRRLGSQRRVGVGKVGG